MRMKSIRKKIYGGWNKKNATLNIILDYKNSNKKNENQIWQNKNLNKDEIKRKI